MLYIFLKKYKLFVLFSASSVLLSVFLTMVILRTCIAVSDKEYASILYFVCGDSSISQKSFKKLNKSDLLSIVSNINESKEFSLDRGAAADKLIDGSTETLAAPASNKIDYQINLVGEYKIKQIIIHWGSYGINKNYVSKWSFEFSADGTNWSVLEGSDSSPKTDKTVINKRFSASNLRLKAGAENDWIGIYELDIIGAPS